MAINCKIDFTATPKIKRWYIVKNSEESDWNAYKLTREEAANLLPGHEIRSPFKNLMHCLIVSSN